MDSEKLAAMRLSGESILDEHCYFDNVDGKVVLHAMPNAVTVSDISSAISNVDDQHLSASS